MTRLPENNCLIDDIITSQHMTSTPTTTLETISDTNDEPLSTNDYVIESNQSQLIEES